jgi:hypothetical protein
VKPWKSSGRSRIGWGRNSAVVETHPTSLSSLHQELWDWKGLAEMSGVGSMLTVLFAYSVTECEKLWMGVTLVEGFLCG